MDSQGLIPRTEQFTIVDDAEKYPEASGMGNNIQCSKYPKG